MSTTAGKESLKDPKGNVRVSNGPAGNVYIEDNEKRHVIVGHKLIHKWLSINVVTQHIKFSLFALIYVKKRREEKKGRCQSKGKCSAQQHWEEERENNARFREISQTLHLYEYIHYAHMS